MTWDPRNDAWFAGFTDGEGCFIIRAKHSGCAPRFVISVRADDVPILEQLKDAFGGRVYDVSRPKNDPRNANPACQWVVASKRELAGLLAYFDRFPLHAKKARDYAIWRSAVKLYCANGTNSPLLPSLRTALMLGRGFDADAPDPIEPFEVQIALEMDL